MTENPFPSQSLAVLSWRLPWGSLTAFPTLLWGMICQRCIISPLGLRQCSSLVTFYHHFTAISKIPKWVFIVNALYGFERSHRFMMQVNQADVCRKALYYFTVAFIGIAESAAGIHFIWALGKSAVKPLYPPFHLSPFFINSKCVQKFPDSECWYIQSQWFKKLCKNLGSLQPSWRLQVNQKRSML